MPKLRLFALFCGAAILLISQTPQVSRPASPNPVFRQTAQEVLLDLVVRDKHERAVRDLKADQIEIYEDGVKQDLRAFRFVSGAEARKAEDKAAAELRANPGRGVTPLHGLNLVSIVFRMMGSRERLLAKQAAEDFLANELRPNTLIGVFSLDYKLNALQQFTNDTGLLKKAVKTAVSGAYKEFAETSAAVLTASEFSVGGGPGGVEVKGGGIDVNRPVGSTVPADTPNTEATIIMRGILAKERRLFAGAAGMREMDVLKVMVEQLGALPGRKTVLMLSTGLQLPPEQLEVFRNLVGLANRYNVSIYGVDVNGLTTYNPMWASTALISASIGLSNSQGAQDLSGGQMHQDDVTEYGLRAANQQEALGELSENTGGFLISNTNDLRKPMSHIMEDVNTHYEVTYSPKSEIFDGHFRKIEVKLLRAGVHVQSRSGYYAVPDINGKPVESYEVAALGALNARPMPKDIDYRVSAQRFRPGPEGWQQSMTFELPTAGLVAAALDNPPRKRIHPTFFAIVKDQAGQIVEKISRDIPYEIPSERFDEFKAGNIIVSQPFSLPPGRYVVESAVIDREATKSSAKRVSLILPEPSLVALSSVSLVRRLDPLKDPADPLDPFQFPGTKVTPTLASSLPKAAQATVYFVVYPSTAAEEKSRLVVQYFRDGVEIGRQTPELNDSQKDASGGIPMLASAKLEPGQYEVRVTVIQGKATAQQNAQFAIEN